METPKEFMNRNGSGANECYWMLVEIGNGVEMDAIYKAMMAYAKYYHEQQVKKCDLADVVNCSSCKYQMNGTTEPCRSCILFSNHTPK
jgi:hypothetical protein